MTYSSILLFSGDFCDGTLPNEVTPCGVLKYYEVYSAMFGKL